MLRRREGPRTGRALAASLVLHAAALGLMAAASGPPRSPGEKVIAVEIVSPPPNVAGERMAEPPATQEPAPAVPVPQLEPQPEPSVPEPAPPAPRPEPAKEPEKAPEPRREPERPAQRPATPPAQRPAQTPARPQAQPPRREPEKAKGTQGGQGSQATRTQGQGTRTGPATGPAPWPDAAGGEGITVRTDGDPCPVQGYCDNVTRQVNRFFRPPAGNVGARGEVCFRIQRDGSVTEIKAERVRGGGPAFRIAMESAAEAAGNRRAFGTLPSAFDPARWKWCVELSPR